MEGIWIIEESGVVFCRGLPQRVIKSMLSGKVYECKRHEEMVRNYIFDRRSEQLKHNDPQTSNPRKPKHKGKNWWLDQDIFIILIM